MKAVETPTAADLVLARRAVLDGSGKELRVASGLSLREAARAVGVCASTLSHWERGELRPRGPHATAYVQFLGTLAVAIGIGANE